MFFSLSKHRLVVFISSLFAIAAVAVAPLMTASCRFFTSRESEEKVLLRLRMMTKDGALPSESYVAQIESNYPKTKVAALARFIRARIKYNSNDANGAASLLDSDVFAKYTAIGDYALLLRGMSLEKAGRLDEARAVYEKLAREYSTSIRIRTATLKAAELMLQTGQAANVANYLKSLSDKDDGRALLLIAKAYEQTADTTRALSFYRRVYFYAPASEESKEAEASITRLASATTAANAEEAITRADRLFEGKRNSDADKAYTNAFTNFPQTISPQTKLRHGTALANLRKANDAATALLAVTGDLRPQALYQLALAYSKARQWGPAKQIVESLRRDFPKSEWTPKVYIELGKTARDANVKSEESFYFRAAMTMYPNMIEVAGAQFELAWLQHEAKNYQESSRMLTEHLALYADKDNSNRGKAGYWAARDSERVGKIAEARAIYEAMQVRYDANWYGYLSKQRLDALNRQGRKDKIAFAPDSIISRAVANLKTVTIAQESAGAEEAEHINKGDQLDIVGSAEWSTDEFSKASQTAPTSPRLNMTLAKIYRARNDNVQAFNILRRSYPDYSQMEVEEMSPEEWDIFYPLGYWDIIKMFSQLRSLDPYTVAGLIRQESVFNPRAKSSANAYGLMQLLVPTGRLTAKKYGVEAEITAESLFDPRTNIELGTAYFRDQMDKYGRIEYVAAAYNAGPSRVVQWQQSLPSEMDEWAEAVPFKETRGYIQGVVRNTLQYKRLYDENGKFRPEVGAKSVRKSISESETNKNSNIALDPTIRVRRLEDEENGE
jgi:soluble lytic murein transglycosylase